MWRLAALALLLLAGCEKSAFYQADTRSWLATPKASAPIEGENGSQP